MKQLFSEIPCLEGEHVILKKIEDTDADALHAFATNPHVYRYLPTFLFEQKYEDPHEVICKLYEECYPAKDALILGVYWKTTGEFCGLAEFYGYKEELHKACIGFRLQEDYWNKGIATESIMLMIDYLFSQTDVEIITASTMVENTACAHMIEKCGFLMTASNVPEDWGYDQPTMANKWFR